MNKTELIDITAEDSGLARDDAAKVIESMLTTVTRTLTRGDDVTIPGFGKFSTVGPRCSYQPQPGYRRRAGDQSVNRTEVHRRVEPQSRSQRMRSNGG